MSSKSCPPMLALFPGTSYSKLKEVKGKEYLSKSYRSPKYAELMTQKAL